jgi:prepilin-type N-terminal cleavage/methylation domain-containing protein
MNKKCYNIAMKRRAFTLVELLVVIAIIGLLSTVAVISLSSARIKSRNAKRIGDIKQLMTAFNLGLDASSTGTYPSSGGNVYACISSSCYGGWNTYVDVPGVTSFFTPFMTLKPSDPSDAGARGYGGYLYNGAFPGGSFPPFGTFPAGPILNYVLEPANDCGPGRLAGQTGNYMDCILYLN